MNRCGRTVGSVREIRERLAAQREDEERRQREEEERLRREEEERRRLEEEQRLEEERKRLKKEREKEKLRMKKEDAKLREEARRLESIRRQLITNPEILQDLPTAPVRKPLYQKKKKTSKTGAIPSENRTEAEHSTETKSFICSEDRIEVDNVDTDKIEKDRNEGDDVDWDTRSWSDSDLKFNLEKVEDESELDSLATQNVTKTSVTADLKNLNVGKKVKGSEVEMSNGKRDNEGEELGEDKQDLRSPICCIMGHVDAGKTLLLDYIRGSNVQKGEAGGITQQIGATFVPADSIRKKARADAKLKVPGLIIIDTPGHETFSNMRSRGSGLCDIAVLVVDIMHGVEPQTVESLNLLKMRGTNFIVALNKVDRLYGWKTCCNEPIQKVLKEQPRDVEKEFNIRLTQVITQFKEQSINAKIYYKNKAMRDTVNIVPTSAMSGEGIPDLLLLLVKWAQTKMVERLTYRDQVRCTVLEVEKVKEHGTAIDVILVNGTLHEGDQIAICGPKGKTIVTKIRALLTPNSMKELRVKGDYMHHKEIKAAQGIKIIAPGLDHAIAGTSVFVVGPEDDLENIKISVEEDYKSVMSKICITGEGVCIQASTQGLLEAMFSEFSKPEVKIPVSYTNIGPVQKKDVMKASKMIEKNKEEYAVILAFDVKVTAEAKDHADKLGVKIFSADVIYQLTKQFKAHIEKHKEEKKKEVSDEAVFPCVLKIKTPNCVFNKKDPIILGVVVQGGTVKVGTPICVPQRDFIGIGRITSIRTTNGKEVDHAKKGAEVSIKIVGESTEERQKMFGRHFELYDDLVSNITSNSLDAIKKHYWEDLSDDEKRLTRLLQKVFKIP